MFRVAAEGNQFEHLQDAQFEHATTFLTRKRRMLFLRGPVFSVLSLQMPRPDSFGPTAVGDDIIALNVEDPKAPIYLWLDSQGGEVNAGLILYDIIRASKAPIVTIAQSCMSLATVLMAAGSDRVMFPHSRAMLHLPKGAFEGDSDAMEIRSKELSRVRDDLLECYIECKVTAGLEKPTKTKVRKQIIADINRAEYWMSAQECVRYGLVDRIATIDDMLGDTRKKGRSV